MIAEWIDGFQNITSIPIQKTTPADNAIPNQIIVSIKKAHLIFMPY